MNKRIALGIVLFACILPIIGDAATPQPKVLHPHANVDVWISPLSYHAVYMTGLDSGDIISISIEETSGNGGIDVYILDHENYLDFANLNSFYYQRRYLDRGSLSTTFSVPTSGTWYVVFWNDAWFSSRHIEGSVGATTPQDISALATGAILLIALVAICCGAKKQDDEKKKKMQGTYHHPQQSQPPSYQPSSNQQPLVRFCSYCGAQRQSYDAMFCSHCGRSFSGPEPD